jgi:hypothetical protein
MALAVVQGVHFSGSGATPSTTSAFGSATTVGNLIIVCVNSYAGTPGPSSVTDSKSNTYTRDFQFTSGSLDQTYYSAQITTGGTAHTVTVGAGSTVVNIDAIEVSGAATSSPFDKSASNSGTGAPPWTSGSTGTLSQADEIVVVSVGVDTGSDAQITEDATYTLIGEFVFGSTGYVSNTAYKIVSATTAIDHTWTSTFGANPWFATAATYKAPAGTPTLTVASGAHAHTGDAIVLTVPGVFTVANAAHAHTADQVPFPIQAIPNNATHGHTADTIGFNVALYADDFNRANTTPGTGGLGANWNSDGGWQIVSNAAAPTPSTNTWAHWNTALPSPDHYIEADISDANAGGYLVLHIRTPNATATTQQGYAGYMEPGSGVLVIERDDGGGAFVELARGGTHTGTGRLRLEAVGTAIRLYRNGALQISATDATYTGLYVGFNAFAFSTLGVGNYDNFAAGNIGTNLTVANAAHAHTADNVVLTTGFIVNDGAHAHIAGNLLLPATLAMNNGAHAHTATTISINRFLYPVAVSNRKLIDQTGGVYILNDFSSWAMASMLTNAEITQALEGVAARHFNAVNVGPFIDNGGAGNGWRKFTNAAGQPFFATTTNGTTPGTPIRDPLGAAWSSMDWIVSECTRLGMTLIYSYFGGYNTANGLTGEANACTVAEVYTFGQRVWNRYATNPNIVWHLEWEGMWNPTGSSEGQRADAFFHAIQDGHAASGRGGVPLIFAEQISNDTNAGAFVGTGWSWMTVSATSLYMYVANSTEVVDNAYNQSGLTTYPLWDCEPSYIGATQYVGGAGSYAALTDPVARQNWRERNYAILIRGGCGINFGDEKWWPFGAGGLYPSAPWTWQDVPTNVTSFDAQYCWDLLINTAYCQDPAWVPSSSWLVAGLGSGDTKAATGGGATSLAAYFPNSRTVTVNTTLVPGSNPVRLRWYDPATGTFSVVAVGEARTASRTVTYPSTRADTTSDWVLVIDGNLDLGVQNSNHGHTADNVALVVPFSVNDGNHSHIATTITLSTGLVVDSGLHAHTANNVGVGSGLTVASGAHAHVADTIVLGVGIEVADAFHAHIASNVDAAPAGVVNSAFHAHIATNIVLTVVAISKIRLGSMTPQSMKVGNAPVTRVYLGNNQVF